MDEGIVTHSEKAQPRGAPVRRACKECRQKSQNCRPWRAIQAEGGRHGRWGWARSTSCRGGNLR